jgi:hypothetical protein
MPIDTIHACCIACMHNELAIMQVATHARNSHQGSFAHARAYGGYLVLPHADVSSVIVRLMHAHVRGSPSRRPSVAFRRRPRLAPATAMTDAMAFARRGSISSFVEWRKWLDGQPKRRSKLERFHCGDIDKANVYCILQCHGCVSITVFALGHGHFVRCHHSFAPLQHPAL